MIFRNALGQRCIRVEQHVQALSQTDDLDLSAVWPKRFLQVLGVREDAYPALRIIDIDLKNDAVHVPFGLRSRLAPSRYGGAPSNGCSGKAGEKLAACQQAEKRYQGVRRLILF
jgi:hypothetical protein